MPYRDIGPDHLAPYPKPHGPTSASAERRHDPFSNPLELLEHDGLPRPDAGGDIDVLHAGVAGLQLLEMLDQLLGRAGEPGAELHIVVERWHAGLFPPATLGGRGHLRRGDARHKTQRREHFYVLFEVGRQLADRLLATVGDVKEDADSEVLAELEVLARPRGGVAIGLDRPLGHGGGAAADRSLDPMTHHEVEPARAGAHDRLPALDRPVDRA